MPLWISLKVALSATLITVLLGLPTAYLMAHYRGKASTLLDSLLLLPLVLPPTVIGFLLLWLLGNQGPFSQLPAPLGPQFQALSQSVIFTEWAAVITATVVAFPLMYRTARAAFSQADPQLPKVARTLGATEWHIFHRIAIPLATPGLIAGTLLAFARALGEFGATLMLAGNIPGKTQTLPMAVYFAVENGDLTTATRQSAVLIAISLLVVTLANTTDNQRPPQKRFRNVPPAPICHSHETPNSPHSAAPCVSLFVNITKHLPDFTLQARFTTTDLLLGILGASGAGKSLLLRCIAGIETPDSGRIALTVGTGSAAKTRVLYDSKQGINLASRDRHAALLFQNYALFPHLTALQNVAFGLSTAANKNKNKASVQKTAMQELTALEMAAFAHYYPHQLSGGQQQRVALARSLATRPQLLLLDEPFSSLDTYLRSRLSQQLSQRLKTYAGSTLLVTHNLTEAYRADQLLILHQGQILHQDSPQHIFEQPKTVATANLTGFCNLSTASYIPAHSHTSSQTPARDITLITAHQWAMNLHFPTNRLPSEQLLPDTFSVGIRPQNVLVITLPTYASYQNDFEAPARMAFPNREASTQELPSLDANQAYCWPAQHWSEPGQVNVVVKLHSRPSTDSTDYPHLQIALSHAAWFQLQQQPPPWIASLPAHHLILLRP